ncbi:unnamed protein product [Sphagnum troendelagicum]
MGKEEKRWYWVKENGRTGGGQGIVAVIGWILSKPRHLGAFTRVYAACGWDSLVCYPHVLNLYFPSWATAIALEVLEELDREVRERARPIVFATFSGGAKTCLYKVFQILNGRCEGLENLREKYGAVRACVAGQIHDSSPVDFVSDVGAKVVRSQFVRKSQKPSIIISWGTKAGAKILDALFLSQFELQRADYWLTMLQSADMGPILILCSTNDELAPIDFIQKFANSMWERGCQITLVLWDTSVHVGHLKNFPDEYHKAVSKFLINAASSFALRQGSYYSDFSTKTMEGTITTNPTHGVFPCAGDSNNQPGVWISKGATMNLKKDHRWSCNVISSTNCSPDMRCSMQQLGQEALKMGNSMHIPSDLSEDPIMQSRL